MPGFDDFEMDLSGAFKPPVLDDRSPCPFGKYKDVPMGDIPAEYYVWLRDQPWLKGSYPSVFNYLEESWTAILQEVRDEQNARRSRPVGRDLDYWEPTMNSEQYQSFLDSVDENDIPF